jgi:TPR repeat protein
MEQVSVIPKKATEDKFNELHNLVTEEFLNRVRTGQATTQDLKAACDWLKTNDITGIPTAGSALDQLAKVIPQVDPNLVQSRLYGKNFNRAVSYKR